MFSFKCMFSTRIPVLRILRLVSNPRAKWVVRIWQEYSMLIFMKNLRILRLRQKNTILIKKRVLKSCTKTRIMPWKCQSPLIWKVSPFRTCPLFYAPTVAEIVLVKVELFFPFFGHLYRKIGKYWSPIQIYFSFFGPDCPKNSLWFTSMFLHKTSMFYSCRPICRPCFT